MCGRLLLKAAGRQAIDFPTAKRVVVWRNSANEAVPQLERRIEPQRPSGRGPVPWLTHKTRLLIDKAARDTGFEVAAGCDETNFRFRRSVAPRGAHRRPWLGELCCPASDPVIRDEVLRAGFYQRLCQKDAVSRPAFGNGCGAPPKSGPWGARVRSLTI
jgi:hypothetical protein